MKIHRPAVRVGCFENIPNCFVGKISVRELFSSPVLLSKDEPLLAELIYESSEPAVHHHVELDESRLQEAIQDACAQYAENISPQKISDRFQDYLTNDIGLDIEAARHLFNNEGIAPFLTLERIFVSEPLTSISFDFHCEGEKYLSEYGFSFDLLNNDRVEFVTPRLELLEGSYPASRKQ